MYPMLPLGPGQQFMMDPPRARFGGQPPPLAPQQQYLPPPVGPQHGFFPSPQQQLQQLQPQIYFPPSRPPLGPQPGVFPLQQQPPINFQPSRPPFGGGGGGMYPPGPLQQQQQQQQPYYPPYYSPYYNQQQQQQQQQPPQAPTQPLDGVNPKDLSSLQSYFSKAAGIDDKIDRNEFSIVYAQMHPNATSNQYFYQMANTVFNEVDTNRSGYLNFNEFISAYGKLKKQMNH